MENSLVTYGFNKDRERIETLSGSVISVVWLFQYLYLHCYQVKKIIGNMTAKNYLIESLSSIFCFIIQGKGSSWKGFEPEIYFVAITYGNLRRLSFLYSRT